jgi:hypothetical protein
MVNTVSLLLSGYISCACGPEGFRIPNLRPCCDQGRKVRVKRAFVIALDWTDGFCHLGRPANIGRRLPPILGHGHAGVVKLVDAPDSKSGSERSVGSIPTARTIAHTIVAVF